MSGICGFSFDQDLNDPTDALGRMMGPLTFGSGGARRQVALPFGRAALGGASRDPEALGSATADRGGARIGLALQGRLYGAGKGGSAPTASEAAASVLDGYLSRGIAVLSELRGEYCLAIWDGATGALHLATDSFRTQPLFYAEADGGLWFASRVRSILAVADPNRVPVDPRAVVDVAAFSFIPAPRTIRRGVWKLPAAHRLTWLDGRCQVEPYWDFDFLHPSDAPPDALTRDLRRTLRDSVAVRLEADGGRSSAVGSFLSGGVDSSTVTGLVGEITGRPARCFSIGFAETGYNELDYARIASSHLGAEFHEHLVAPKDVTEALPALLGAFDEPFGNASAIPTYCCARFAREQGIEVLYAGDGGDELFAGNQRYASRRVFDRYEALPEWLRRALVEPAVFTAARLVPLPVIRRAKRYIQRANGSHFDRMTGYDLLRLHPVGELFQDGVVDALGAAFDPYEEARGHYHRAPAGTDLDRELYLDLKMTISDNDVVKVTRMCEAAGVGVRFPFLDRDVAAFATRVPASLKIHRGQLRWFFKQAYPDLLPPAVRAKKKHGFGLPIAVWLRSDPTLRAMVHDLVLGRDSRVATFLKRTAVEDVVRLHGEDTTQFYGTILWNLLVLELQLRASADASG